MKKLIIFMFSIVLLGSCSKEEEPNPVDPNPGSGGTTNPVFSIVGNWKNTENSSDGGNSWYNAPDGTYKDFASDGTLIYTAGGNYSYHYNYCSDENLYRMVLQGNNSQQLANQNCDCVNNNTLFTYTIVVSSDGNKFEHFGCNSNGDIRAKFVRQ